MTKKCVDRTEKMTLNEFLGHTVAQGGNWAAMFMSGIRDLSKEDCDFKKIFDSMPENKTYSFIEVLELIEPYVDLSDSKKQKKR